MKTARTSKLCRRQVQQHTQNLLAQALETSGLLLQDVDECSTAITSWCVRLKWQKSENNSHSLTEWMGEGTLQYSETVSLAVLPPLQLVFLSAGVTKHRAASCVGELAWNVKCMETLYNVLAKACLITSNLRRSSNAVWHRGKYTCYNPLSLP